MTFCFPFLFFFEGVMFCEHVFEYVILRWLQIRRKCEGGVLVVCLSLCVLLLYSATGLFLPSFHPSAYVSLLPSTK